MTSEKIVSYEPDILCLDFNSRYAFKCNAKGFCHIIFNKFAILHFEFRFWSPSEMSYNKFIPIHIRRQELEHVRVTHIGNLLISWNLSQKCKTNILIYMYYDKKWDIIVRVTTLIYFCLERSDAFSVEYQRRIDHGWNFAICHKDMSMYAY